MNTYKNLQGKSAITQRIIDKVREAVHAIVPNADIILFGSRARGDALDYSDWDFLILTEKQPHFELVTQIRDKLYEIELEMDTILSAIIRSRKEWESGIMAGLPFKQEVEKDGVRI